MIKLRLSTLLSLFEIGVLAALLSACQNLDPLLKPNTAELKYMCADATEVDNEKIAKALGLTASNLAKLQQIRNLSNQDICEMPTQKLERAMAKSLGPKPDHPGEAAAFRHMQRRDESGTVKPDGLIIANQQRKEILEIQEETIRSLGLSEMPPIAGVYSYRWTPIGPGNIGGRVRSILIHPTDTNKMWAGSVSGGIWNTTDGGLNWSPVNDFMGNLSISTLVMDPSNSNVLFAATGEGFYNGDAVNGAGIFKSVDGGVTWNQMSSTNPTLGSQWYAVNRLAIHPTNSSILLAATNGGTYRTTDSGNSWSQVYSNRSLDVDFDPNNGLQAIIGGDSGNIAFSTNSGATWISQTIGSGRVELAYAKSASGTAYAAYESSGSSYILKSINGGSSWSQVYSFTSSHLSGQGWYANAIWVDPTNASHLIVGGLDLFRSTNGGSTWTQISQWYSAPTSPHADHHIIVSSPSYNGTTNKTVFFGNDGGIYKAADISAVAKTTGWTSLNNGLNITQFYGGAGKLSAGGRIIGGTQDNGDLKYSGSGFNWQAFFGGDGGYSAADGSNDLTLYGEYVYLTIHRSTDGGISASNICSGITEANPSYCGSSATKEANFIAPFILDPNNNNRMLAGAKSLWVSENIKATTPTWGIKKNSTGLGYWYYISAIAVAEGDSNTIWVGHNNGSLYKTSNGTASNPTWTQVTGTPARPVLRILIDKSNTNRVFVALGGYSSNNLQMTNNSGVTWTSISSTLPSAPIRSVVRHPTNPNWLYAGTEVGVFTSENSGSTWNTSNDGPSNVPVDELFWYSDSVLVAATHGRGMFYTDVLAGSPPNAPILGTVTAGNSSITISFTPGSSGTGTLTNFTAGCSSDGVTTISATGSGSPITVTGLTNGTSYYCFVRAKSTVADGPWSSSSNLVTPIGPPGPVTSLLTTVLPGKIVFTFTAPVNNGGSSITGYKVSCASPGQTTIEKTGTSSPISVSGFTSGKSYTCSVTSLNSNSSSSPITVTLKSKAMDISAILMLLLDD
jgi:hypothetical protein